MHSHHSEERRERYNYRAAIVTSSVESVRRSGTHTPSQGLHETNQLPTETVHRSRTSTPAAPALHVVSKLTAAQLARFITIPGEEHFFTGLIDRPRNPVSGADGYLHH